jgi:hypothetical protein
MRCDGGFVARIPVAYVDPSQVNKCVTYSQRLAKGCEDFLVGILHVRPIYRRIEGEPWDFFIQEKPPECPVVHIHVVEHLTVHVRMPRPCFRSRHIVTRHITDKMRDGSIRGANGCARQVAWRFMEENRLPFASVLVVSGVSTAWIDRTGGKIWLPSFRLPVCWAVQTPRVVAIKASSGLQGILSKILLK